MEGVTAVRTGYIHIEQQDGRYWWVDPQGKPFFAVGTCRIQYPGQAAASALGWAAGRTVSPAEWDRHVARRLRGWHFNLDLEPRTHWMPTSRLPQAGAAPHTAFLDCSHAFGERHGILRAPGVPHYMTFVDIFDPRWPRHVARVCAQSAAPRRAERWLAGYFTDNELFWGWGIGPGRSLLDGVLAQDGATPAKQALVRFLRDRYASDLRAFNRAWRLRLRAWSGLGAVRTLPAFDDRILADKKAFLFHWARHYFRTVDGALRRADPNHLNLGVRVHGHCEPELAQAMGEFVDVVSYNKYDRCAPVFQMEEMLHRHARRPVLVSEWGFRAEDAGLANTGGVGRLVRTQRERGARYAEFLEGCARSPVCVGAVWYAYVDDDAAGAVDPLLGKLENSNYGLVDVRDRPYAAMLPAVRRANRQAQAWHRTGPMPTATRDILCPRDFHFQPRDRFVVQRHGVVLGQMELRAFLLGPDAGFDHQPAHFEFDEARPVTFIVWVYQTEGRPVLEARLDGRPAARWPLPAGAARGVLAKRMPSGWQTVYDRECAVRVPAGPHTLTIRNAGTGWLWLNAYRVRRGPRG